jgi:hypothetical protein
MSEIKFPQQRTYYVARDTSGNVLHVGYTDPDQVTTSGQPVFASAETESEQLDLLSDFTDRFPELPAEGERLQRGEIYQSGGVLWMVRQDHIRTHHDPAEVLALFLRHNPNGTEWVSGEQVELGTIRSYNGSKWRAIQSHVTQDDWTPDRVPALWQQIIEVPPGPQPWVQPTGAHDAYNIGAIVTYNGQTWRSTVNANVWAPGVFGWVVV